MLAGIHYFGALLLFAASILILITTITAPVVDRLAILEVTPQGSSPGNTLKFGTFGWCVIDGNADGSNACSSPHLGYTPADVVRSIDSSADFSNAADHSTRILTKVMVLHPVAAGLCFIGAILGAVSGMIGSFVASLIALLSFVVALVALACDFALFTILRNRINDNSLGFRAAYAEGIWTLLAGTICALVSSGILFLTCCFGRSQNRRANKGPGI